MTPAERTKAEFGDYQTAPDLARVVCGVIRRTGFSPASIVEPTCGRGTFLRAALEAFPGAGLVLGVDRNTDYVGEARASVQAAGKGRSAQVLQRDFFDADWQALVGPLPGPLLILGNPPWVTNAKLGAIGSANLPQKMNHDRLAGLDALTGKSNFDISECMLRYNLGWIADRPGMLAVLCKTAVARKVLRHAWLQRTPVEHAEIRRIDAKRHFGAAVDACLLVVRCRPGAAVEDCSDYPSLEAATPSAVFGLRDGRMVADVRRYERWRGLAGGRSCWRSGIKHDCRGLLEVVRDDRRYRNGFGEEVEVESDVVFPLLKSSDLARNRRPRKWLIVPQRTMTESPDHLERSAPRAWRYLIANADLLDKRGSAIYRGRPRFSIFGVGEYSFAPWKVAISGLYKKLEFVRVSPFEGRPVVLDDTCYFFSCGSEEECRALHELVTSEPALEFWSAFVFWDAKRPITAQVLNLLDLAALARALGRESDITRSLAERQSPGYSDGARQQLLFT